MDYQWYFMQSNSGGGEGGNDNNLSTRKYDVTTGMLSAKIEVDWIAPEKLAWRIDAFESTETGVRPVVVSSSASASATITFIGVSWETGFNGYLELTTWEIDENNA